jgi:hypothetical protein
MFAYRYWGDKELRLEEAPMPVSGGGALVKIRACSICGTDVRMYRFGIEKTDKGRIAGHEMAGLITDIAPGLPGDFKTQSYLHIEAGFRTKSGTSPAIFRLRTFGSTAAKLRFFSGICSEN